MFKKDINLWLVKIDRIAAWMLFVLMIVFIVSGYGMTKGIISRDFSLKLHLDLLPLAILIFFCLHSSLAIRLLLMRWSFWNNFTKLLLILFFLSFLSFFAYIELFYEKSQKEQMDNNKVIDIGNNVDQTDKEAVEQVKVFTLAELSKYNGKNGMPAYVAVDGIVYDLSRVFSDGRHFEHFAGSELTGAFYSFHVKSSVAKYPIVGKME